MKTKNTKQIMENKFKIGDKVFHLDYGWGEILDLLSEDEWLKIRFKDATLAFIGYNYISFTEYTLQGFSQERPIELPKIGDWCLVRDSKHTVWQAGLFKEYRNNNEFPFVTDIGSWKEIKRIKILD